MDIAGLMTKPWALKQNVLKLVSDVYECYLENGEINAGIFENDVSVEDNYRVSEGVAYVPIRGIITKKPSIFHHFLIPLTSIMEIKSNFKSALKNPAVKKIVLEIDSPGGSVDGVAEFSDLIFEARERKPIVAHASGLITSAAYWIGSSADKIYATNGSEVGSIGVYTILRDFSMAEHNAGITTHFIKAGEFKAMGHPSKPLTDPERNEFQDQVNTYYGFFVDAVKRNRKMSTDRALQLATGKVFIGENALKMSLIDGLLTP